MSRLLTLLASFCVLAATARAEEPESLTRILDRHWRAIESHSPKVGVRECVSFSLDSAAENWYPERIGPALAMALEMRDLDETSRFHGNYRWRMDDPRVFDPNAVEFITSQAILLRSHFAERLTSDAVALLDQLLEHSILGIERHHVPITYTNIYLMKTWNLVGLGETLERPALADAGYQMLDDWIAHTQANGIVEYLSPTYYGVDLDSLGLLARDARRPEGRAKATAGLRYIWADIAANWYEPGRRLGGAHSRDYDYLTGRGELDVHLSLAGWLEGTKLPTRTLANYAHWQPTEEFRKLSLDVPRVVSQRWGNDDGHHERHRADQYVGRKFSIGSTGASYASMDKPLVVNLPGGPTMPQMTFFMDARGDAYGKTRVVSGGTHQKSLHLVPLIASAQRDAEVLMLAADDPKTRKAAKLGDSATCLLSHIVLPAACELWDVEPIEAKADRERSWPGDVPLFLRLGDIVVGVRVVMALDTLGIDAPIQLVDDGLDFGVRRLTCVHAQELIEGTPTADGTGVVALWVRAAEGLNDAGFAEFRKAFEEAIVSHDVKDSMYRVTVQGDRGEMSVAIDMSTHEALPSRGGNPSPAGPLVVNGRDVGSKVLKIAD